MPHPRHSHAAYLLALTSLATFFLAALTWIVLPRCLNRTSQSVEVKEKSSDRPSAPSQEKKINLPLSQSSVTTKSDEAAKARLNKTYGKLPLSFEANQGQTDKQVKFLSRGNGHSLFLAPTEMVMELSHPIAHSKRSMDEPGRRTEPRSGESVSAVLRMQLEGANPQPRVTGLDEQPGKSNYFIGNDPHKWRTNISNYAKVKYENAYPGIDLVYYGNQNQLEYDFIVASGADPDVIRLKFDGAQRLNIDRHGDLVLRIGQDEVRQHKPKIYQEIDGIRREIAGRYVFRSENEIGFDIAAYDRNKALVIDPLIDGYSTFLGGSAYNEAGYGIAVDGVGRAYITGVASAPDFPSTSGPRHDTNAGDVFVARLSADGSELEYSTLIGGILQDEGYSIAVDSDGNAYATGMTNSPDFPTVKPYKSSRGSDDYRLADAFVTKLDATGKILYSTFLGGTNDDIGYGIAVDKSGDFYVTGLTVSSDFAPPVNSFQSNPNGGQEAFLTKFSTDGATLLYFTYFGGSSSDAGNSIAVDDNGGAYITGRGSSPDMYISPGAFQQSGEGFVAKFDTNASGNKSLIYSTHIRYRGTCVAVDRYGDAYVGDGVTVDKLNATGSERIFSQYIGTTAIALDAAGNAYVTGTSGSLRTTPDAFQPSYGGGWSDAFMAKLSSKDGAIVYATYLGGRGWDLGYGIAVDDSGSAYVTGKAQSNFPTTPGAFQSVNPHTGGYTERYGVGFVTKIALAKPITPLIFVPGIAGSSLDEAGGSNLWLGSGVPYPLSGYTDRSRLTLDPNKQQRNIVASDVMRTETFATQPVEVYTPLLQSLTNANYREYAVNKIPARRTTAGCDMSQNSADASRKPNLFVFAYDWRKSNAENAVKLKDYVGCVEKFYPDSKVNILAHSMGGLLARRYILDNPDAHHVDKLITIGSPWLGAPKAIYTLETGRFFDNPLDSVFKYKQLDNLLQGTLKGLVEFFPGSHQLLPSKAYFDLGGRPFSEYGWDINNSGNGKAPEGYMFNDLTQLLNARHPNSIPGTAGFLFHTQDYNGKQDDWRGDQTGVEYYHIYGEQSREKTIGQVTTVLKTTCTRLTRRCRVSPDLDLMRTSGDGTVPLLSARRTGNGINLNAGYNDPQDGRYFIVQSPNPASDGFADHVDMTKNPYIQNRVLSILRGERQQISTAFTKPKHQQGEARFVKAGFASSGKRIPTNGRGTANFASGLTTVAQTQGQAVVRLDTEGMTQMEHVPSYYMTFTGTGRVTVTDAAGNSNTPIDQDFERGVPGVDIDPTGDQSAQVVTETNKEYSLTFHSNGEPVAIEVIKGINNATPQQVIRYIDLTLPAGATALLKITPQGVQDLRYDADGDGVFEATVPPTASAVGAEATDREAPTITFSERVQGTKRVVTLTAQDAGTGVLSISYSLDGVYYQPYTSAIIVDPAQNPIIHAFADDNVANRSGDFAYKPLTLTTTVARDSSTREIIVTATIRNDSTASVTANFVLNSAKLNSTPTTTTLPTTINMLAQGETVIKVLRFPAMAAATNTRATLSGTGTSQGTAFSGSVQLTVP